MAANDLVFFENNYVQSSDDFAPEDLGPDTPKTAVLGCVTIDGYTADSDTGEVVCEVYMMATRDVIISWHNNGYRLNSQVKELIQNSINVLNKQNPETNVPYTLHVFPKIEFDNNTAVICKYSGEHTRPPKPSDIDVIVEAVKKSYEAAGMTVTAACPVSETAYKLFEFMKETNPDKSDDSGLKPTTVSWHGDEITINENMLVENRPDDEILFCVALHEAWVKGFNQSEKARAFMELYGLSSNRTLFCRDLKTLTGKDFVTLARELIADDSELLAEVDRNMKTQSSSQ